MGLYLSDLGYTCINIDISPTAISQMNTLKANRENVECTISRVPRLLLSFKTLTRQIFPPKIVIVGDVSSMPFETCSFDYIIDKGCLDAFSTDLETAPIAEKYLAECHRLLRSSGEFILISFAARELYNPLFMLQPWEKIETGPYS
jgi:SAM-dependent methyltransferase